MRIRLPLIAALLSACTVAPLEPAHPLPATVVLVSVDGLRPADVTAAQMPALTALGEDGVRATLRPSYPTLTFPNHYTLVTGLRPDHHGIVHNQMTDPALGEFRTSDKAGMGKPGWWGGEPVWVSVIRHGARAFTAYWPGSEAPIKNIRPTRCLGFTEKTTADALSGQVRDWMRLPKAQRARFITVYFAQVDKASHDHGPDSTEAYAARRAVDRAIQDIAKEVDAHSAFENYNLVVVSDHGFAEVKRSQQISTDAIFAPAVATPVSDGQVIGFQPKPSVDGAAIVAAAKTRDGYRCYSKDHLPAQWRYGQNPRVPPVVCQLEQGWDALMPAKLARVKPTGARGSHGYDPDLPDMAALFIARGPAFARHVTLPEFDNVNVYPLLMHVLGLPARQNDGDLHRVSDALATPSR